MADKITEEERARIVAYLRDDKSQGWIARKIGRSKQSISRVARDAGLSSDVTATKRATEARRDYRQAERLKLINEGFEKARELLKSIEQAKDLQAWTVALGTLVDKRRLEDGQVTDRTEKVDADARTRVRGKLDELAARRRANGGAVS